MTAPTPTAQQPATTQLRVMRPQPHCIRHSTSEPTQFWVNINFDAEDQRWVQVLGPANSAPIKIDGIWYWRYPPTTGAAP